MRTKSDFRTSTEEKTLAEARQRILAAINSLSPTDHMRLKAYATFRIRALGHLPAGLEANDLLHEAIAATVDQRRPWKNDTVPFFAHLYGVMRSIASGWSERAAQERRRRVMTQESVTAENAVDVSSPIDFERFPAAGPNPESIAGAQQLAENLTDSLQGDATAVNVLAKMMDGWQDKDIPAELGMSRKDFEAAKKRIQRRFQKIVGTENVQQKRIASEVP